MDITLSVEEEVQRKKDEHLRKVNDFKNLKKMFEDKDNYNLKPIKNNYEPCRHDGCSECHGTGIKLNGLHCIHYISCPCPKCSHTLG